MTIPTLKVSCKAALGWESRNSQAAFITCQGLNVNNRRAVTTRNYPHSKENPGSLHNTPLPRLKSHQGLTGLIPIIFVTMGRRASAAPSTSGAIYPEVPGYQITPPPTPPPPPPPPFPTAVPVLRKDYIQAPVACNPTLLTTTMTAKRQRYSVTVVWYPLQCEETVPLGANRVWTGPFAVSALLDNVCCYYFDFGHWSEPVLGYRCPYYYYYYYQRLLRLKQLEECLYRSSARGEKPVLSCQCAVFLWIAVRGDKYWLYGEADFAVYFPT